MLSRINKEKIWTPNLLAILTLSATSGNPETAVPDGKFDTGYVAPNQSIPIIMSTEPGEYTYFCTLHPFVVGTVLVQ